MDECQQEEYIAWLNERKEKNMKKRIIIVKIKKNVYFCGVFEDTEAIKVANELNKKFANLYNGGVIPNKIGYDVFGKGLHAFFASNWCDRRKTMAYRIELLLVRTDLEEELNKMFNKE